MATAPILARAACGAALAVAALAPAPGAAQARPARQAPQAPTPQLVTVRPRTAVAFDAQVLVPLFYDRSFWPSIVAGYAIAAPDAPRAPTRPPR